LILSPAFPPLHTVRAGFPAYRVPSLHIQRLVSIPPLSLQKHLRFGHCFWALIRLLIFLRQLIPRKKAHAFFRTLNAFPCSDSFYLYMMSLGAQYKPAGMMCPSNTTRYFIIRFFTLPHRHRKYGLFVSGQLFYRLFNSRVRQSCDILTIDIL